MKLEFRDGDHEIPDYLADLMAGMDTYRLTVEEAIKEANDRMLKRHLEKAFDEVIDSHMRNAGIFR